MKAAKLSQDILEKINEHHFDFDPDPYLPALIAEFRRERPRCCDWCLLDVLYSSSSLSLFPFFSDLLQNARNWYERDTAVDWLIRVNTEEAKHILHEILIPLLCDPDHVIREAAARGLRNLETPEAYASLWQIVFNSECILDEDTQKAFAETVQRMIYHAPKPRNHHIIP